MNFDATIHLGDVITVVITLAAFIKLYGDFRVVSDRVSTIWSVITAKLREEFK